METTGTEAVEVDIRTEDEVEDDILHLVMHHASHVIVVTSWVIT